MVIFSAPSNEAPPASASTLRLSSAIRVCALMSSGNARVIGSDPVCPEMNNSLSQRMAGE
jgi:hypothetical protein